MRRYWLFCTLCMWIPFFGKVRLGDHARETNRELTCVSSMVAGLYSDASANLNHPLAGAWDNLQSDSIQAAMRHTISSLERRVVPIIPYSHLAVDTGYLCRWSLHTFVA